ncbi:MAG: alanine/ornithine racemase family PLP-dependent enzyme [Lutibacter sp.]|uniref:alanine/ornithine racemase family PLP-dependent enzyme n=1 Tax=Lutibacter sp. TaxID=1925666 RepID=UPI0017EF3930|nr:alanine/ornithine racemase family PLP-dependent enzyme [Lutibacter sp.]MBT8316032.1 alanine/ornithine racemase family PLP-dependent enzyme [Lutibacter sp.]NNJ56892.1 alanine/ornithine racemase family PLP-dependent enzyme [Lutibacter sp.]
MAYITLNRKSLAINYSYLKQLFNKNSIEWAPVLKMLCGNKTYLEFVLSLGEEQVCDARLTNLKTIKSIDPKVETIYIKPPAKRSIKSVVKFADVSFNTEFTTIKWLSEEAKVQNKVHRIIIMIELGDLREGILGEHLLDFYKKVFELPNIKVVGIGANLNCLSGVMPSKDKLIQLSLYEQLIEAKFGKKIDYVTGGSSVMIPLLLKKQIPKGINHFRIGETLFFGVDLFSSKTIPKMKSDVFVLHAEIIEITEKPIVPFGEVEENPSGEIIEINPEDYGNTHKRGILDIGLLDIATTDFLEPINKKIDFIGASSDMLVVDLTNTRKKYKVGDVVSFKLKYMGALRIMNSKYIDKKLI